MQRVFAILVAAGMLAGCGSSSGNNSDGRAGDAAEVGDGGAGDVGIGASDGGPGGPIASNLAVPANGGGCYPIGINASQPDQFTLVDPEWAPVVNGQTIDSTPVLVHGTAVTSHGDIGDDFPTTHVTPDQVREVLTSHADLARKLARLEAKYDQQFKAVFDAIRELMAPPTPSDGTGDPSGIAGSDAMVLARRRALRRRLADQRNVPAYVVFNDVTLLEMAARRLGLRPPPLQSAGLSVPRCGVDTERS